MGPTPAVFGVVYLLLTGVMGTVMYRAWQYREQPGATPLVVMMGTSISWSTVEAIKLISTDPALIWAAEILRTPLVTATAASWFYVAVEYTGWDRLTRSRYLGVVGLAVLIDFVGGLTNGLHHLYFEPASRITAQGILQAEYGPLWYVHAVFDWVLLSGAFVLLVSTYRDAQGIYRKQTGALIVGMSIGWATSVLNVALKVTEATPVHYLDPTPFGLAGTGSFLLLALFRWEFLAVAPVARQTLMATMDDAVIALDTDDHVIDINAAACDLFGVTPDVIGETVEAVVGTDPTLLAACTGDDHTDRELTVDRDGTERVLDLTISPVSQGDSDRAVQGRTIVIRDITEKRRRQRELERQQELERNRELLARTQQLADVGGWELDPADGTMRWTDGMARITGVETDTPSLETMGDLFDDPEEIETAIDRCVTDGEAFDIESRLTTASGEQRWVETHAKPSDDGATATRVRGAILDITDQKRRERELQRQNEQLDKFASYVSHDLRNPLGIAEMYTEFAADTGDPEDFQAIRDAHDRMDRMIDDLLTLARADTVVEEPTQINVPELVRDAWATVRTDDAELVVTVPDDWTVEGDPDLLQNVFENLFRNAVEHATDETGATTSQSAAGDHSSYATGSRGTVGNTLTAQESALTITVGAIEPMPTTTRRTNETARGIYVADDGPGIPDEEKATVFDHGYTTDEDGVGFGLTIVQQLVDAHDWEIRIVDSADGGARFEIITGS